MFRHIRSFLHVTITMTAILDTADRIPKASRVRGASLPKEYELCRVLHNISNHHPSWTTETPACSWKGVTCDSKMQVREIRWNVMDLRGTISWRHIPVSVKVLILGSFFIYSAKPNEITGELPVLDLPPRLKRFVLDGNNMTGNIDLEHLPAELTAFEAAKNCFEGTVSLSSLPRRLLVLDLQRNLLSGELDLSNLPPKLEKLYFANNQFSGGLILKNLPFSLARLDLDDNNLSGELELDCLPSKMRYLLLKNNAFEGLVDLRNLSERFVSLDLRGNKITSVEPTPFPGFLKCDL